MSKKKPLALARGSIRVIANQDGKIQWHTACENIGDCWSAFVKSAGDATGAEIKLTPPKHRTKAISKAKREGWRCVQIWAIEIAR